MHQDIVSSWLKTFLLENWLYEIRYNEDTPLTTQCVEKLTVCIILRLCEVNIHVTQIAIHTTLSEVPIKFPGFTPSRLFFSAAIRMQQAYTADKQANPTIMSRADPELVNHPWYAGQSQEHFESGRRTPGMRISASFLTFVPLT